MTPEENFRHDAAPLRRTQLPKVVGRGLWAGAEFNVWRWDRALRDIKAVQEQQLLSFVQHAAQTRFGRQYGFAGIKSYADYQRSVPVTDYDTYAPYIERMRLGERNHIVPEFVEYYGNSSGTSNQGRQKFLPITERQIRYQKASGTDALCRYLAHHDVRDFTDGYVLGLFPPTKMKKDGPVYITSNPALMMSRLPKVSRPIYLPDPVIMEMSDYDQKLERIAERYLDYDVRMVTGTTCWFSLLFDKLLDAARRRGRNVSTVSELWPNLRVLLGGGVAAGPYLPVIRERVGRDDVQLIDTYNATEGGIFAATHYGDEPGMLFLPHRGVFFEFIPLEDEGSENPRRIPLWEVEAGQMYVILVTTPSGLYSYKLGDIVRFTCTRPLCVEFAGRLSGCLSTTQELTTHVEIQAAFEDALAVSSGTPVDFAAGADVGVGGAGKSRYVLFAEFSPGREPSNPQAFIDAFDASLRNQNRVYREHRTADTAILAPELVLLPAGSVKRFMQDIGNTSVQSKFPRILDDARKDLLRSYAVNGNSA